MGQVTFQRVYSGTYGIAATGSWSSGRQEVVVQADEAELVEITLAAIYYFPHVFGGEETP